MKTIGIVAEYNPFHHGHAYQLAELRRAFGADTAVVVAMSGDFTQRGEPAIADKWVRAEAALRCGVDLVLEIPFVHAAASAERFAFGGVSTLAATGVCGRLAFGSESGSLEALNPLAELLADEPEGFRRLLKERLDGGASFPAARQAALGDYLQSEGLPWDASLLSRPNDILAIEYLKALRRLGRGAMEPYPVRRMGAGFHDQNVPGVNPAGEDVIASASALRKAFLAPLTGGSSQVDRDGLGPAFEAVRHAMPPAAAAGLLDAVLEGIAPVHAESLATHYLGMLRSLPAETLDGYSGMGEGLSRRLKEAATSVDRTFVPSAPGLYAELTARAATRRFPSTRIARALAAMAVGVTGADLAEFDAAGGPRYLRVLGFTKKGRYLLKRMRDSATLPIITRTSDFLEYAADPLLQRMAEFDLTAADLHRLAAPDSMKRRCGHDFDMQVLML